MSFLAGWIALACGLLNLIRRKGTTGHRAFGLLFVLGMCLVAVIGAARAASGMPDPFALAALASFAVTIWAVLPFAQRRPNWLEQHAYRMQGAFIALCAAGADDIVAAEIASRAPAVSPWPAEAVVTLLIALAGWRLALRQQGEVGAVAEAYASGQRSRPVQRG